LKKTEVLAVIAARGGSKGLPGKHLLKLCNKHVIDYTFEYAKSSKLVSRIILTTDDKRIKRAADAYQIETIMRPESMATDTARINESLVHVMEILEQREEYLPDYIVLLYGNMPVRKPGALDKGLDYIFQHQDCKCVRSMISVGSMHPYIMATIEKGGKIEQMYETNLYRRQDMPDIYIDEDSVIIYSFKGLMETAETEFSFPEKSFSLVIDKKDAGIEIDDLYDFDYAEYIIKKG
jgi:CMP-N,N'-diacetyllegionaminic acid synthase